MCVSTVLIAGSPIIRLRRIRRAPELRAQFHYRKKCLAGRRFLMPRNAAYAECQNEVQSVNIDILQHFSHFNHK